MNNISFNSIFTKGLYLTFIAILISGTGILSAVSPALANTTTQLLPITDGTVYDFDPFDGVGDAVDSDLTVGVYLNAGIFETRGVMEFDLTAINSSGTIQSALLKIVPLGRSSLPGTSSIPIQLFGYSGNAIIGTDDFVAGSVIAEFDGLTAPFNIPVVLDVTGFLQSQAPTNYVGFSLRTDVHGSGVDFGSLEAGSPATLIIEIADTEVMVDIDIKPGSNSNPINANSFGTIPVAILSSPDFDAPSEVNKTSLTFGRTGEEESLAFCNSIVADVNGDGLLDQVCHFKTQLAHFQSGDTEGILLGQTMEGVSIEGHDVVSIVK